MIYRRHAFTLIEILVSLMIFSIVSTAMLAILFAATEIYRRGEAGRAATDEAVAVLAQLDGDLARLIPAADNGWLHVEVVHNNGSQLIAFLATPEDPNSIDHLGVGSRVIVTWWVDDRDVLHRFVTPEPPPTSATDARSPAQRCSDWLNTLLPVLASTPGPELTKGCLHFGAGLSLPGQARDRSSDWTLDQAGQPLPPVMAGGFFVNDSTVDPFPEALAITLILTGGGRFAHTGFVIEDAGSSIRVGGVTSIPAAGGSLARLGPAAQAEWVRYEMTTAGTLECSTARAQLRSVQSTHARGDQMLIGNRFTLVRSLAH